mgnify:CR=1 FL=1
MDDIIASDSSNSSRVFSPTIISRTAKEQIPDNIFETGNSDDNSIIVTDDLGGGSFDSAGNKIPERHLEGLDFDEGAGAIYNP